MRLLVKIGSQWIYFPEIGLYHLAELFADAKYIKEDTPHWSRPPIYSLDTEKACHGFEFKLVPDEAFVSPTKIEAASLEKLVIEVEQAKDELMRKKQEVETKA